MKQQLSQEEITSLHHVLKHIVIKQRTGEIGIEHGADRFVSTNMSFKKKEIQALESALSKLGISSIKRI